MAEGWRKCGRCGGRRVIGRGLQCKACPECRGSGTIPPDHLIEKKVAMEEARAAMPDVNEIAGYCRNHPCLCSLMKDPNYPPPCIPCRCRRYGDALGAYADALRPAATTSPTQGEPTP